MVNMNKFKDPAVYALVHGGRVFYVGYTSLNAQNRLWEHNYRAQSGHQAPVYRWMRDVGTSNVSWKVLERVPNPENAKGVEAAWIKKLLDEGEPLTNSLGMDGVPGSVPDSVKAQMGASKKGKPSWIKGLKGEAAGWTDERRKKQSEIRKGQLKHGARTLALDQSCPCDDCLQWRVDNPGVGKGRGYRRSTQKTTHGTVACYKHGGCRCEECTLAYRNYQSRFYK